MENVLSFITFLPLIAAIVLALFLRGDDEAAQRNAKYVALVATSVTFFRMARNRPVCGTA